MLERLNREESHSKREYFYMQKLKYTKKGDIKL